uniref:Uncharacterized protein n=1 Tax=Haptolina brevifila TaxID=156173 RepID=A0A7S2FI79_9EUKA
MAAADSMLAAMLRLRMDKQSAKKEKVQQLLHFKLRVLDLIDALAKRSAPPASLLLLPLPMLRVMISAAPKPAERPLLERTTGVVRRLAKLTVRSPWPNEDLSPARLMKELEALISLAEKLRTGGTEVASALTETVLMLLRVMSQHRLITPSPSTPHANASTAAATTNGSSDSSAVQSKPSKAKKGKKRSLESAEGGGGDGGSGAGVSAEGSGGELTSQVLDLLRGAVRRFYTQKNCRLHTKLVTELLRRQPSLGWSLAPTILTHVDDARDSYLCSEACTHMELLVQQRGGVLNDTANPSALSLVMPTLLPRLAALLSREGVRAKHLSAPLRLAHTLLKAARADDKVADVGAVAATLVTAVEAMKAQQGSAARSLSGQSQKVLSLATQIQAGPKGEGSGEGGPGSGKKSKQARKGT